jgi:hypothetical protein
MKRTSPPQTQVTEPDPLADFEDEDGYFKDIFYPDFDELPGETAIAFQLRYAFTCAGYRGVRVEEMKTHPVVVVRAVRQSARRINDDRLLFRHVRDVLRQGGFSVRGDELTVGQTGDRILAAFLLQRSPHGYVDAMNDAEEFAPIPV